MLRFPEDFVSLRVRERNDSVIAVMIEEHRHRWLFSCTDALAIDHFLVFDSLQCVAPAVDDGPQYVKLL